MDWGVEYMLREFIKICQELGTYIYQNHLLSYTHHTKMVSKGKK
jgi:hypothetical protein